MLNFTMFLRRGTRVLIAGATFSLFRGEKVGITGANGTGKSSLLALIQGELHPEAGSFEMPSNLEVAHVSQELLPSDQEAIEFYSTAMRNCASSKAGSPQPRRRTTARSLQTFTPITPPPVATMRAAAQAGCCTALGFQSSDETRPVHAFSGGWRVRLKCCQGLMCRSDLLLLDEPTNHLDIDAILWLEEWLRAYPDAAADCSRSEFLDRVVNRVVNIEHTLAKAYRGNYSHLKISAPPSLRSSPRCSCGSSARSNNGILRRALPREGQQGAAGAERLKALERMQRIAPAHVDSQFEFSFGQPLKLPRPLLAIENQSSVMATKPCSKASS